MNTKPDLELDPITFNIEITVESDGEFAKVFCPEELRITERVASILHQAMQARGLKLKHWVVSEEQKKDMIGLSNVILDGQET